MKLNKRIITVMVTVLALFLVLVGYLTYFTVYTVWAIFKYTEAISIYEISCKNKSKLNLITRQNRKEKKSDD